MSLFGVLASEKSRSFCGKTIFPLCSFKKNNLSFVIFIIIVKIMVQYLFDTNCIKILGKDHEKILLQTIFTPLKPYPLIVSSVQRE